MTFDDALKRRIFEAYWRPNPAGGNGSRMFAESVDTVARAFGFADGSKFYAATNKGDMLSGACPGLVCVDCHEVVRVRRRYDFMEILGRPEVRCKECYSKRFEETQRHRQVTQRAREASSEIARQHLQTSVAHDTRSMRYRDYLGTEEWQVRRSAALRRADNRCQVCNSAHALNVHHRTYERRGVELESDLTVLCAVCHELFHSNGRLAAA